ncbi:hypothetical protein QOT17_021056 [Balamuthia mandrillaris]
MTGKTAPTLWVWCVAFGVMMAVMLHEAAAQEKTFYPRFGIWQWDNCWKTGCSEMVDFISANSEFQGGNIYLEANAAFCYWESEEDDFKCRSLEEAGGPGLPPASGEGPWLELWHDLAATVAALCELDTKSTLVRGIVGENFDTAVEIEYGPTFAAGAAAFLSWMEGQPEYSAAAGCLAGIGFDYEPGWDLQSGQEGPYLEVLSAIAAEWTDTTGRNLDVVINPSWGPDIEDDTRSASDSLPQKVECCGSSEELTLVECMMRCDQEEDWNLRILNMNYRIEACRNGPCGTVYGDGIANRMIVALDMAAGYGTPIILNLETECDGSLPPYITFCGSTWSALKEELQATFSALQDGPAPYQDVTGGLHPTLVVLHAYPGVAALCEGEDTCDSPEGPVPQDGEEDGDGEDDGAADGEEDGAGDGDSGAAVVVAPPPLFLVLL